MIYEFKCSNCDDVQQAVMSVQKYERLRHKLKCGCGGKYQQLFSAPMIHSRTQINGMISEHVAPNPVKVRDQHHFRDLAAENGLVPTNPWDGI